MAYAALPAKSDGQYFTLANYNAVRDNFAAGVPDIFTTKGDIAAATAADTATRVAVGADDATLVADASAGAGLAWQIQPAARVYNSALIDPPTSTWVSLTFDSERFDTDTVHSTVTNTARLTIPANGSGLYTIGACVEFDTSGGAGGGGNYGLRFLVNGTTVIAQKLIEQAVAIDLAIDLTAIYALSATNYVELQVYTTADVNVLASGNYSPEFWINFERRQ